MKKRPYRGGITIFLSLLTAIFLALIFTVLEGIHVWGTRVRGAACLDLGLFSVFGEYDREILSLYHVFFLDSSYGSGSFGMEKLSSRMRFFMDQNADLRKTGNGIDWFHTENRKTDVEEYLLVTDEEGRWFREQAELFMEGIPQTEQSSITEEEIEEGIEGLQGKIQSLNKKKKELESFSSQIDWNQRGIAEIDPMKWMDERQKDQILEQVIPSSFVLSDREVSDVDKVSERSSPQGNMKISGRQTEEGRFQRYLFFTFGNAGQTKERQGLLYELEYLLEGNKSDYENLEQVCSELLEIRWADNFSAALVDEEKRRQVKEMLENRENETEEKKQEADLREDVEKETQQREKIEEAFLLAWAYEESRMDVQKLFMGYSIPISKGGEEWEKQEPQFWKEKDGIYAKGTKGIWGYESYLKLLFRRRQPSNLPMKALDLVEWEFRSREETKNFRADCCIAGISVKTSWEIRPIFFQIPSAFLGTGQRNTEYTVKGSFFYGMGDG